MNEQLTRYVPEPPGRESRDIVATCATCQQPIYTGQYAHQCDYCGRGNTCYCVEELPLIENLTACAECVKEWDEYHIPEVCSFCDEKGIRGEMLLRKNGYACEVCIVIAKWAASAQALESVA